MRIWKSALAVLLCFLIDLLRGAGTPFYSAIAALLCMKRSPATLAQYGFQRQPLAGADKVWFYLPLVLIEILPLAIYGVAKGHVVPQ